MFRDDDVHKLARLARLALTDDEARRLAPELARIVAYVDAMKEVDVDGVEPMIHGGDVEPVRRADGPAEAIGRALVQQSAGLDDESGLVRVPRVVE